METYEDERMQKMFDELKEFLRKGYSVKDLLQMANEAIKWVEYVEDVKVR